MQHASVEAADAQDSGDFRGQLLRPSDEGYEAARRIWNGSVDRLPGLIARSPASQDVVAAVTKVGST